jgi:hypothetical protein
MSAQHIDLAPGHYFKRHRDFRYFKIASVTPPSPSLKEVGNRGRGSVQPNFGTIGQYELVLVASAVVMVLSKMLHSLCAPAFVCNLPFSFLLLCVTFC